MIPRCFVDPARWEAERIRLSDADAHHLIAVLRAGRGAEVAVCDGCGGEAVGTLEDEAAGGVFVRVRERRRRGTAEWRMILVQAVPKGDRMEWIIQKAVELGAWSVVPVMTDRGVVRLEGERAAQRVVRWQRIATEAAKQCRTAWITRVEPVVPLRRWLESPDRPRTVVVGSLEPEARPFRAVCGDLRATTPGPVALLIGPEGDFSAEEHQQARAAGASPVSFGRRVLRVETAAVYALGVLAYELDVMAAG